MWRLRETIAAGPSFQGPDNQKISLVCRPGHDWFGYKQTSASKKVLQTASGLLLWKSMEVRIHSMLDWGWTLLALNMVANVKDRQWAKGACLFPCSGSGQNVMALYIGLLWTSEICMHYLMKSIKREEVYRQIFRKDMKGMVQVWWYDIRQQTRKQSTKTMTSTAGQ